MAQKKRTGKNKKLAKRRRRRRQMIAGLIFVCLVSGLGISYFVFHQYVSKYPEDTIYKNIYAGNVELSGMKKREAKEALENRLNKDKELGFSVQVNGKSSEGTLGECGLAYKDIDKIVDKAMDCGKKGSLWERYWKLRHLEKHEFIVEEEYVLDENAVTGILTERALPLADRAKNAAVSWEDSGITIKPEQAGETIDMEASVKKIEKYLNEKWDHRAFSVKADMKKEEPSVKAEDLEGIQDELGSFSTDAGEGERWQNLAVGVEKLNGTLLMPGEELSVYEATGPYDEENGYVPGASYENGKVVESYGGGVCQVSTTLYNAVLYAELEVVERYPHSMLVSYVAPSRDAAIAEGFKDFVFKNNYDTPVYIHAEIDSSNQLCFAIYGKDTREEGRTVEYESETVLTVEPGVIYKADSESSFGSMQTTENAHTGKEARLWKIVYQDGEEVDREVVNNSTYNKTDRVISVGIKSENAEAVSRLQQAIASQDEGKISEAIAQGQ